MRAPEFWRAPASLRADALTPLGDLYGAITASRALRQPKWTAPVPVLCVGNVMVGGTGKTPVCLDLAARLHAMQRTPHFLTRGYGGAAKGPLRVDHRLHTAADVGDEALLLAQAAPTWVGGDRAASAKCAVDAGSDVLVMDDGFQNPGLAKTASLLVFDGGYGIGNGKVFPAGPLREPLTGALKRAHAAVIIGDGDLAELDGVSGPVLRAAVKADPVRARALAGKPVIAFAGIGRPEKFFQTLRDIGADVRRAVAFADHHPFRRDEIKGLIAAAQADNAALVTTAKDHVRLPNDLMPKVETLPVTLNWQDGALLSSWLGDSVKGP